MIDEKKLVEQLKVLKDKCWNRAKKENNINFARKQLDISQIIGIINNQPKIGEWIPCSERLPNKDEYLKDDGRFIVTDGNRRYQSHYDIYDGNFKTVRNIIGNTCDFSIDNCVIAWQPLPNEYKECD